MIIKFDEKLLELLPNIILGCIQLKVRVNESSCELVQLISDELNSIEQLMDEQSIRDLESIKTTKDAYRKLGKDPNRYRPSSESLIRRVAKGKGLYRINNVVDILNLVSVRTGYSICGFDMDKIQGDIVLGLGIKGEPYIGIGRGEINIENIPVFRDDCRAFGTPTSDSLRTMITDATKKIMLIFMVFDQNRELNKVLDTTFYLYDKYAEGELIDMFELKGNVKE
ncbi:MAG: hypothetical protein JW717_08220 [Marinilabiliaceae bacterium]|nr:hypothetical protein [Marinilabiliaceae bacterium]